MMFDRSTFAAGAAAGAAIVSVAWLIVSWTPKAAEPHGRYSVAYDRCLATGRNATACDAAMRVWSAEYEKAKRDYVKSCLAEAESKDPGNRFNKFECADPFPNEEITGFARPAR
jgi:hypothetical protein